MGATGWKIEGVDAPEAPAVKTGGWVIETEKPATPPASNSKEIATKPAGSTAAVPGILAEEPAHAPTLINSQRIPEAAVIPPVDDRSDARKFLETPLISPQDIEQAMPFLVGPFALQKGLLKGAAGMTSPESAAIIAGTGGLGMAADATAAGTAQAARVAQAGLSAYFATQAGKATLQSAPEVKRRWDAGDWQGALEAGGQTLLDAAITAASAAHSVQSLRGAKAIGETGRRLQENLNAEEAANRAAQPKPKQIEGPKEVQGWTINEEPPAAPVEESPIRGGALTARGKVRRSALQGEQKPASGWTIQPAETSPAVPVPEAQPPAAVSEPVISTDTSTPAAVEPVVAGLPEGQNVNPVVTIPEESKPPVQISQVSPAPETAAAMPQASPLEPAAAPQVGGAAGSGEGELKGSTIDANGRSASVRANERAALLEPRRPSNPERTGQSTTVRVPGENRSFDGQYAVRELDDVHASHNPFNFEGNPNYQHTNDRNYSDAKNAERVIRQAQQFDPAYLLSDSPTAEHGAPVIDANGNVLGGNSRTMTLQRVYQDHPQHAEAYRRMLAEHAQRFGIAPAQIAGMKRPVLVRKLTAETNAQHAITDLNKTGAASLTPAERALSDSRRLSDRTLEFLQTKIEAEGQEGTLLQALEGPSGAEIVNRLAEDGIITPQEKPQYTDERGVLTAEGKQRISRLMVGRLFRDSAQFENTPPEIRNKLERAVAPMARTAGRKEWDLTPAVQQAVDLLQEARARGIKNLSDLNAQQGIFGDESKYPAEVVAVAGKLKEGPRKIAAAFNQYASDEILSRPGQPATMFEPPSRAEAFAAAFNEGKPLQSRRQTSLLGDDEDALIRRQGEQYRDKLTGERLTAQFKSGMAFKPAKLRPAETPNMFEDGPPEQGALFAKRLEGPSFRAGMSRTQKVSEAQVVPTRAGRERYPVLQVNAQAMDLLHEALGIDGGFDIPGVTFTVPQAESVLRHVNTELRKARLKRQADQVTKWEALRSAIEQNRAAAKGGPMAVVQHGPDVTPEETAKALQEELDHVTQLQATGDFYANHLGPEGTKTFLESPAGSKAAEAIRRTYPEASDSQVVMEVGVRLMRPGRYQELGLTADEAQDLQDAYVGALITRHGVERTIRISEKIGTAHRKNTELKYGHQTPLSSRRGDGREETPAVAGGSRRGSGGGGSSDGGLPPVSEGPLQSRREGPRFKKQESRLKTAADVFKSVRERIKQQGPAGLELMRKVDRADTLGTVFAGKRVAALDRSGLAKLTRQQAFGTTGSLLDALEGRGQAAPDVRATAKIIEGLFDQTAAEAVAAKTKSRAEVTLRPEDPIPAGAKLTPYQREQREAGHRVFIRYNRPFQKRSGGYAPHVYYSSEALRKGKIREDILDNLVHVGAARDAAHAGAMLDQYRQWLDNGGRATLLEKYLVESGQARDEAEAFTLMRRMKKRGMPKNGSLEYARIANLPFYDPDMRRVLPRWIAARSMRLAQIREFNQDNAQVNRLIHAVEKQGGDAEYVRARVDRGLKMIREGVTSDDKVARFFTTLNGFKLSYSFMVNSTQGAMNTFLHTHDLGVTAGAVRDSFTKKGRQFAAESGASLDGMINEMVRSVGRDDTLFGKALEKYLGVTFTPSERVNRIIAANAGHRWATKMLDRLKKNPVDQMARQELSAMGLKPDVLLRIGKVDGDAALVAGKAFSDLTQFRSQVWDMPDFATKSGMGRIVWQFKNYGYQQMRLGVRDSIGEINKGLRDNNWMRVRRGMATILILAALFPMTGEVVADLKSLLPGGRKRPTKALDRYLDDVAQSGAMGLWWDAAQGGAARRGTETVAGPTMSTGGMFLEVLAGLRTKEPVANTTKAAVRAMLSLFGGLGNAAAKLIYPPKRPAQSPEMKKLLRPKRMEYETPFGGRATSR